MLKENEKIFTIAQKLVDCSVVGSSWLLAYYLRFTYLPQAQQGLFLDFVKTGAILVILSAYFFNKYGLYSSQRFQSKINEILTLFKANFISFITLIFALYFFKFERLSRIHLVIYIVVSSLLLIVVRISVRNLLRKLRSKGYNLRHVLLVGDSDQLKNYVDTARSFKDSGLRFIGWIDDNGLSKSMNIDSIDKEYEELKSDITPDTIVLAYSALNSHKTSIFLKKNYNDLIPIQILPDLSYSLVGHQIEDFAGVPLLTVNQPNFSPIELFIKRTFDLLSCGLGIILISPLLILIATAVKLSSKGPVFYSQIRVGLNGKEFKMWKFRSMRVATENEDLISWSSKDDPRKTKVGELIRKTSLDELPQLWNVIIGDMSLVGPRPERPHFVEQFRNDIPNYMLRHKMKAGITGWAQVNGWRGDTSLIKRIECDIYYIKNWSLWLDFKIISLTFIKGFLNKNAY
jgi:Undecaprenyl-phosphate glucose phosphotransferase